ncbi:phosphatase PAP2 family protein [soil metagenome]
MTAGATAPTAGTTDQTTAHDHRLRWWREVLYVAAFYFLYSYVRNQFGSASVGAEEALANAVRVIDVEHAVGLYHEEALQELFLDQRWFIQAWNVFYGTFHFVVTAAALVWTFRRFPARYRLWRNVLALTTGLALIGFATFPLMPPRLLPDSFGYVDTLVDYGGLWSFDSDAMKAVSNQYAAMPSLHCAWSLWCSFVLVPEVRRRWVKGLLVAYPVATLFAVMVTANHYWLDAVGGYLVLAGGYLLARPLTRWQERAGQARTGDAGVTPARPGTR